LDSRWDQPLRHIFGTRLHWVRELSRGIDHEPVVADRESKSLSHETTFEHDTHDRPFLERTLRGFLRDLARDLRQEGLAAGSCTVKLKNSRFVITTKQHRFPHPLNYDPDMWPTVQRTLHVLMQPGAEYRLAGLALSSLTPAPPGLFDQRRTKAIETMDALIAKHGSSVIGLGGMSDDTE
jgi:DNA polymerase-4